MSVDYLIDLHIKTYYEDEVITGKDDEGKYEICNMCKQKIYEHDEELPLENGCCNECLFGIEGEID